MQAKEQAEPRAARVMGDGRYGAGELLAMRRKACGVTLLHMATVDGKWKPYEIGLLENRPILQAHEVRRYLDALEKAGGG